MSNGAMMCYRLAAELSDRIAAVAPEKSKDEVLSKDDDETKVTRRTHGKGKDGSEVVLVVIEGGGHTWPGMKPPAGFMGKSTRNV